MSAPRWKGGNRFRLLENGEAFFPAVFEAIESAQQEVILETFILYEDKVGLALHECLLAAARRGVRVDVTMDGYGSPDLSTAFVHSLTEAGVRLHVFDAKPKMFGRLRTNLFRRMHRKIVVVDGRRAFVGGINYSADHLADFGPEAKQDYAVEVEGPVVADIHRFVHEAIAMGQGRRRWWQHREHAEKPETLAAPAPGSDGGQALFVTRDNREHHNDIERHYRIALRSARREVIIANAYFFPGYRLIKDMRRAARRGVKVSLILQGQPDMPIVKIAARMLYDHLLRGGVRIHEYCDRPLHGKVALADDEWATVGSSNLDPLSLALNLEANVVIRDRGFNATLRERLHALMDHSCQEIDPHHAKARHWWQLAASVLAFHVLRRFPAWAGWLPAHEPTLAPASDFAAERPMPPAAQTWQWRDGVDMVNADDPPCRPARHSAQTEPVA
ncbi:cardiolipin synthase ClsB [Piscinibacter terrae]|uniref:Cardiolipin synthase B n=1 Tax=Piscinibacter terrae TaxID=2496871 RepID=A0A3N7JZX2_9BURK|nr:cardiolipin synthase ClsB [Albitalea terrae]RQP24325.1 cardiolipin synthase ClsB [Albitalea terrae]